MIFGMKLRTFCKIMFYASIIFGWFAVVAAVADIWSGHANAFAFQAGGAVIQYGLYRHWKKKLLEKLPGD